MLTNEITLYGAGGHCKVVLDILESIGLKVDRIVDDSPTGKLFMGFPLSKPDFIYDKAIITIGNCAVRKQIVDRIEVNNYLTAIHPSSIICSNVPVGEGSVIVHGAIVQSSAKIGRHCILNTKSSVDHDAVINDFVHIASGATICGASEIGECTWIGAGSVIKQGIHIGKNCMIGAGSVVVKNIPNNVVAFGNPCKVIRENK